MNTKLRTMTVFVLVTSLVMLSCAFVQSFAPASDPVSIPEAATTEIPVLEPTSTLRPTATARPIPTATPKPFAIQDESFQEYEKDCNTDVNITSVEADGSMGITVNSTITMLDGGWAVFCYGAKHTWIGTLTYAGYTFASDTNDPLLFMVDQNKGYVYIKGSGTVTSPDGSVVNLGNGGEAPVSVPSTITVTECTSSDDCPDSVWIADLFEENETLEYNTEYKVTISADKKVRFYYGWCTIDQKTLDENLKDMKFVFTIDGTSYLDSTKKVYYEQEDDTAPTKQIYCYGVGGVASGWQEAQTYKVVFGAIFEKEIYDGWDTYPKSENLRLYSFTVDSDGAAPALTDWNGIPVMPGASGEDYMGDYKLTTKATTSEIQTYYKREMVNLGWEYRADMAGSAVEQVFVKDEIYVFFMVAPEGDNNIMYIHRVLP